MSSPIENWHLCIEENIVNSSFLDESIEFYSPFVYKPIQGIEDVMKYLNAANVVINNEHFKNNPSCISGCLNEEVNAPRSYDLSQDKDCYIVDL